MTTGYYVSVINGNRKGLLLGPYGTHAEALENVPAGRALACKADTWADFYAFGTCKIERDSELPKAVFCNCGWQQSICAFPYCEHGAVDAARDANQ